MARQTRHERAPRHDRGHHHRLHIRGRKSTHTHHGDATAHRPASEPGDRPLAYSATEIATHASTTSCWLLINNRVYDVTTYLSHHPGRIRAITPWCGKESTKAFATEAGRGEHSPAAYDDLKTYFIGVLATL